MSDKRARWFFNKVALMRAKQKEYFRTRNKDVLAESKMLEREVDAEIERVESIERDNKSK